MIAFIAKVATVISAVVRVVRELVSIAQEAKRAYAEILAPLSKKEAGDIPTIQPVLVQAEVVKAEVKPESVEITAIEQNKVTSNTAKKIDITKYPEVDLSIFEGKYFSWGPSLEDAFD